MIFTGYPSVTVLEFSFSSRSTTISRNRKLRALHGEGDLGSQKGERRVLKVKIEKVLNRRGISTRLAVLYVVLGSLATGESLGQTPDLEEAMSLLGFSRKEYHDRA